MTIPMPEEQLAINTIFTGLTRPPMVMGITLDYLSICFMFSISLFIATNSFTYLVIYLPLHMLGWIACKIDPNIFRILLRKLECLNVQNKRIWGCQSYEPF